MRTIYKIIEDKKWEYRCLDVSNYDMEHYQLDSLLDGDEGWECFCAVKLDNKYDKNKMRFFLRRSYIEKKVEDKNGEA